MLLRSAIIIVLLAIPAWAQETPPPLTEYLDAYRMSDAERTAYTKAMATAVDEQCACYRFVAMNGAVVEWPLNKVTSDGDRILIMMGIRRGVISPLLNTGRSH
jgi:hypothetical protein